YGYNAGGAPSVPIDSKPTFEQTFEQYYEKPGWNDVWAGVLARRHILVYLIIWLTRTASSLSSSSVSLQSVPFLLMVMRRRKAAMVVCVTIALSRRKALIRIVGGIYNGNNNF